MSLLTIFWLVLFFTILGAAYVVGYDFVRKRSPENMARFYLMMAAIRMVLVLTVVGIYILFSDDRSDAVHFAAWTMMLYAVMMIVTLILKH